jgi:predicted nucleic acid-binding protein
MNSDRLESVLNVKYLRLYIGQAVLREAAKIVSQKEIIDYFTSSGKLIIWSNNISVSLVTRLIAVYGLGDGETESIAICIENGFSLCCDDKKARSAAQNEITGNLVMGSLRLLKLAVSEKVIKCTEAQISYLEMVIKGGFLPKNIAEDYFCKA